MNHQKPTQAELDADLARITAALDNIPDSDPPAPEPTPSSPPDDEPEPTPSPEDTDDEPETPEPSKPPEPTPSAEPSPDYRKKFKESSKEGQILYGRNKAMAESIEKASQLPEPTEEELKAFEPDYDVLSEFEKKTLRNSFKNDRFQKHLAEASKQFIDLDKWREEITTFIESETNLKQYPDLRGKEDAFTEFASKAQYKGTPFELLVAGFMASGVKPKVKNKGQMFHNGTGGPNEPLKKKVQGKITLAQAENLKQTNYAEYKRMIKADLIGDE